MSWNFGRARGFTGLTGAATTIFDGDALVGTVREAIQNSLDAGKGHRVSVGISLDTHAVSSMPGVNGAVEPLRRAYDTWLERANKSDAEQDKVRVDDLDATALFYRQALELAESKEVSVLGFHDWGTTGLTGPVREKQGVEPGPYVSLVLNNGDNNKTSGTSLGSFGQGSKAPIALSLLRTVFYLTNVDADGVVEDRFIGKALWSSAFRDDVSEPFTTETGFFSSNDETLAPFCGADIPDWASATRAGLCEGTGTSVYIPCPYGLESRGDFEDRIYTTVMLNFYFAIESGRLDVVLPDGRKLSDSSLRSIAKESKILERQDLDEEKFQALLTLFWASASHKGFRTSDVFGDYFFAVRADDSVPGRSVSLSRAPGMFITASPPKLQGFPSMKNFNMFVCVIGDRGQSVMRAAEPPTHDRLEFHRIRETEKRKSFEKDYLNFAGEVRALAGNFAELATAGSFRIKGLADLLGGVSEDDDTEARIEFPKKLKITQGKKRSKRESVGAGAGIPGPSGSDGLGGQGGGGGSGNGNGKGTQGSRLIQTTELLLEVDPRKQVATIYFSVDKPSEASSVRLYESGENQREPIRFSTSEDGPLVGEILKEAWEPVGKGKHRFKVTFFPDSEVNAMEAWLQPKDGTPR